MQKRSLLMLAFALLFGMSGFAFSDDSNTTGPKIGGNLQAYGFLEGALTDTNRTPARVYLFLKQARLNVSGKLSGIDYYVGLMFGGEELPNGANSVISLLDAYADVPLLPFLGLKVGQFKVPYSREQLSDHTSLQFADTSINTLAFNLGRDMGVALHGKVMDFQGAVGIFTGGGIDVPLRFLPQVLGVPMIAARVGFDTLNRDLFTIKQLDLEKKGTGIAVYANVMYEKDSKVGHSSVMLAKKNDLSLFYNTAWNPYLRTVTTSQVALGDFWQAGGDIAFQTELSDIKITAAAEGNWGYYANQLGSITIIGGEAQASVYYAPVEVAVRYGIVFPDPNMGYYTSSNTYQIVTDNSPIHEINPALNIYFNNQNVKLTMDMQIFLNAPIVYEIGMGPYNLMLQPSQTAYIASKPGSTITRQIAINARMLFQFMF